MQKALMVCLILVGLINFVPVLGVLSVDKLNQAYGIKLIGDELVLLMRHRALLFGILGGFVLFAAFLPTYQLAAMTMAGVSMLGFAVLVHQAEAVNEAVQKVLWVDWLGIVLLAIGAVLKGLQGQA